MKDFKRILVTSALPYANGPIHLGHLAGAYLPADIYVRYQRLKKRDVLYICGSDEHGVPITIAAENQGVTPQDIVDKFHSRNEKAFAKFGISFDFYGRTSSVTHRITSQEFFLNLHDKGIFKKKTEHQLFDPQANMFLPDRYVKGECPVCGQPDAYGDQCEKCGSSLSPTELKNPKSTLTNQTPVLKETEHWYIPLGDFQERVENWVKEKPDWKPNVTGQVKSWLNDGLADRAVTRDLTWGVPVPLEEAEGKVLYVWFDAPIGYISATKEYADKVGEPLLWKKYWQNSETKLVHFIGKDNIVFHCIMFPAMLMEHGSYVLPDNVPANEFLNLEGQKLSTSKNYAVWLEDYIKDFPVDSLRYYLAINAPETKDADFTWSEFQTRNNSELADILGNFVNRTLTFAKKRFEDKIPERGELDDLDKEMLEVLAKAPQEVGEFIDNYEIRKATSALMDVCRFANKYFNDQEPWVTVKNNPEKCATTINICVQAAQSLAVLMAPILPFSAEKAWKMIGNKGKVADQAWDKIANNQVKAGQTFGDPEILFKKIEDEEIQVQVDKLQKAAQEAANKLDTKPLISFEEFGNIDLRVAEVLEAEKVKKSKKLLKLQVMVGKEKRQIVAGIAQHYEPEKMVGKKIIIVANLKPATIMGVKSQGMLLAAEDDDGKFSVLSLDQDVNIGAKIR